MEMKIELDDDLMKKFSLACRLTGDNMDVATKKAIAQYTRDALIVGAHSIDIDLEQASSSAPLISKPITLRPEFLAWFKEQQTPKGQPYNPVTISGYAGRIQNTCKNPGFETVGAGDLFEITDPVEFALVVGKMRQCPAYAKEDLRTHNGLSAALKKYEQFLRERQ